MTVRKLPIDGFRRGRVLLASMLVGLLTAPTAMAGPEGGQVVGGEGNIVRDDPLTTTINQFTEDLVIDWATFNVASDETVNFVQPGSTSTALNRIWDQDASQIFGTINANGRIILVNSNGILFGRNATVNTGSLIASGLSIDADDFMAGNWEFANPDGSTGGMVINRGLIEVADGGSVSLFGGAVENSGTIIADFGSINLAAGETVTIDFDGDGLLQFAVNGELIENAHGVDSAVANTGELIAQGGSILLSASAARDVFSQVVNNEGVIEASGVESDGGRVFLTGQGGDVYNSGVIDASSEQAAGGTVHVLGDRVALHDGAVIDVSGATGGGDVRVGGELQGDDSLYSAARTFVGSDVTISADATVDGDGGTVIVWSDEATRFYGQISARGAGSGDGGFAEVSGRGLDFDGDVDLGAENGEFGTLLLDPDDIIINAGTGDGDDSGGSNTDLSDTTIDFGDTPATYNVYESELEGVTADIVLQATNSITTSGGPFTVTLQTDVDITLETTSNTGTGIDIADMTIETTGNAGIIITAGSDVGAGTADILVGDLSTGDRTGANTAAIVLTADDAITVSGTVESGNVSSIDNAGHTSGNVTLTAGGLITVAGTGIVRSGTGTGDDDGGTTDIATGAVQLDGGSIVVEGSVTSGLADNNDPSNNAFATSGAVTLSSSAGDIEINGSVSSGDAQVQQDDATSGDVSVTATGGDIFGTGSISSGAADVVNGDNSGDVATSGGISLSGGEISADGSTAFAVGAGAVTGAGTFSTLLGSLSATASGTGADGEILLVSDSALRIGNLDTADADTNNVSIEVTGGNLLEIVSGATVTLDQDNLVLAADEMSIDETVAATGRVTLTASTAATSIDLGSTATTANTTLELSDAELDNITGASVLQIGDSNVGTIDVSAAINTANVSTLHIINGAANITQAAEIIETNLAVTSGGIVTLNDNNNDVDTLAGTSAAGTGNFNFRDSDDLVIGTVDGVTGITSGTGGITLRSGTTLNDLDDAADYLVTSGALSLRSNGVIGGANAEGLNIDAASVDATLGTGGNNITLTDSGSGGATTYAIDTGGAGTVSITQDTNNVVLDGVTTTGNLAVLATTGTISQTNGLFVDGTADFTTSANDQSITLDHVDNTMTGTITFTTNSAGTNAGNVVLNNNGTTNLGASTIDGSLTVTSEQEITQAGVLTVAGASSFQTTANDRNITLNTFANALSGPVSFTTVNGNGDVFLDNGTTTIDFGTSSIDGDLTAVTGGTITQSGALVVTGASDFTTDVDDQSITLSDTGNAFTGVVTFTTQSSGSDAGHVVIDGGTTALDLGTSTIAGNLAVTGGGGISQSGALTVAGTGDFTSDVADQTIVLSNTGNAISGDVSFSTLGTTGDATFDNGSTNVVLAASTVNGALDITTGGTISQSGALTVSGTSSFTTDLDDQTITLTDASNAFTGAVSLTTQTAGGNTGNVSISSGTTALDLGASTIAGFLTAASGGGITQSGSLTVAGIGVFTTNVDDQAIVLDNTSNAITGAVSFTTQGTTADVTFDNGTTAVDLATSSVAGNLAVTSGSTIGQSGAITVSADAAFTTDVNDQAITLNDAGNDVTGAVSFTTQGTTGNVSYTDAGSVDISASSVAGTLAIDSAGSISDSGSISVSGTSSFTVADANDVILDFVGSDYTGDVSFLSAGTIANITIDDASAIDLQAIDITGNLVVTSGGTITQAAAIAVDGTSSFTTDVADQAITLTTAGNDMIGAVSFSTLGTSGDVSFDNDTTSVDLGASTVNGALDITTGGTISQSGALTVSGTSSFTTDLDDQAITLTDASNAFTGAVSLTTQTAGGNTGNVSISSGTTALDFGTSSIAGFLTATSGGGITQSGSLTVAGIGVFTTNVDDQAIVLDNTSNAITGAVSFTTQGTTADVTFDNGTTAVDLATSGVAGNLAVTSGSTIGQSGALTVSGTSGFTTDVADQAITLTNTSNAMSGAVSFSTLGTTGDVSVDNGTTTLDFGASTINGSLAATTGGSITQSGALDITGNAAFTTDVDDQSITLSNASNDVDGNLSFTTQTTSLNGGHVTYVNGDPGTENDTLTVTGSTVAGNVDITADDNITVAEVGIDVSGGAGNTVSLVSTGGDLLDSSPGSDTNSNVITAGGQVSLTAGGSIGGGADPADFDVSSTTDLVLSAGGDVYVSNDVALSSFALTWTPSGNVFSLGGATTISLSDDATDTTLASVNNGGSTLDFSLTTTSGDLYIDDGAISGINAGTVTLTTQAGSILDSDLADVSAGISIGNGAINGSVILNASGTIGDGVTGDLDILVGTGADNVVELASGGDITLSLDSSGAGIVDLTGLSTSAGADAITIDQLNNVALLMDGSGSGYSNLGSDDLEIDGGGGFVTFATNPLAVDSLYLHNSTGTIGIATTITATGLNTPGDSITISTTGQLSGSGQLVSSGGSAGDVSLTARNVGSAINPLAVQTAANTQLNLSTTGVAGSGAAYIDSSGQPLEIGSLSAANFNIFSFENTGADIVFTTANNDADIDLDVVTSTSGNIVFDANTTTDNLFASAADNVEINAAVATAAATDGASGGILISAGGNVTGLAGSVSTGDANDSTSGDGSTITSGNIFVVASGSIDNGVSFATGSASNVDITTNDLASSGDITFNAQSVGSAGNEVAVDFGSATSTSVIGVLNVATTGVAGSGGAFITAAGSAQRLRINNLSTASATAANEFNFIHNGNDIEFVNGASYSNLDSVILDVDAIGGADNVFINQAGTFGVIEVDTGNALVLNQGWSTADNLSGNTGNITVNAAQLTGTTSGSLTTGNAENAGAVSSGSLAITGQVNGNLSFAVGDAVDSSGSAGTVGDISIDGGIIGSAANAVSVLFGSGDTAGQLDLSATVSNAYITSAGDIVVGDLTGNANFGSTISIRGNSVIFDAAGTYSTLDGMDIIATATGGGLTFGQAMSVGTFTASATGGDVVVNNTITANDAGAGNTIDISTTTSGGLNGTGSLVTADQTVTGTIGIETIESGSINVDVVDAIEGVSFQAGAATVTSGDAFDIATVGDISLAGSTIGSLGSVSVEFGTADAGTGANTAGVLNLDTDAAAGAADVSITTTSDISLGSVTTGAGADDISIVSSDSAGAFELTVGINAGLDGTLSGDNFSFAFADSGTPTADSSFNNNGNIFDINGGTLSITADSPSLSGTVDASGGVTVAPADAGSTIGLGTGAGVFTLNNATIVTLTNAGGGLLTVGNASAGAVTIDDVLVGGTDTLEIITGSTVNDDDDVGDAFNGGTLVINAGGNIGNLGGAQGLDLAVDNLEFSTTGSVVISEFDGVTLQGTNTAGSLDLSAGGAITDAATASLVVTGLADLTGSSITLGDQAGDAFSAATLNFNSGGAVNITADSAILVTGTNTANSLILDASGTITDAAGVSLTVTNNANFTANDGSAQDITLGDDASDTVSLGGLTFVGNNVDIETDSSVQLQGSSVAEGDLVLNANAASDDAGISENGSASLDVTGNASFLAESAGIQLGFGSAGTFNFGSLTVNTMNGGNVVVVEDSAMLLSGTSVVADFLGLLTESGGITDDSTADLTVTSGFAVGTADGSDIVLDDNTHNFGSLAFAANGGLVEIHEASDTLLDLSLMNGSGITAGVDTLTIVSDGAITDDNAFPEDSLTVTGTATFTANSGASDITLGDATNGHTFGTLTFTGNNISIIENDAMELTGSNSASGDLSLTAAGAITDAASTSLSVTGNASLVADSAGTPQAITLGDNAGDTIDFGSLTFDGAVVTITEDSETVLSGASSASALTLSASVGIVDDTTANVTVSGAASFSDTGSAGIVLDDTYSFGTVILNTGASATLVEADATQFTGSSSIGGDLVVNSGGALTDSLTSSVAVTGNMDITATSAVLGNDLGDTFNAGSLTLSTTGGASITEDSATRFSGTNSVGGSMTIISSGNIDDDGTGSIAVTNTTNFNAGSGNDVVLDQVGNDFNAIVVTSANNVTLVDANSVTLGNATVGGIYDVTANAVSLTGTISADSMDLDATGGAGAINQSAGTLTVANLATLAAQTGDNVLLNQAGNDFASIAVTSGNNVVIRDDAGGIALAGVIATGAAAVTSNGGAITDAGNDTATDIAGTGVTLSATDGDIGATGANGSIDIDAGIVNASTTDGGGGGGSIFLNSVSGATVTFNNVTAAGTGNDVELIADNNIGLGSITADNAISVQATAGNIDDFTDDNNADLTASSVTLTADAGNIGGAAPQPGVPADLRRDIEINAGTVSLNAADTFTATAQSVSGAVVELSSTGGGVDFVADATITINSIDAGSNDDVTLVAIGDILDHADDNAADIVANNITLTATGGDIGGSILAAVTGADPEHEIEVDPSGTLTLTSNGLFLNDLSGNLVTLNFTGTDFSYTSSADILVGLIDASGTVTLTTTGGSINDATTGADTVNDINGTTISLNAVDEIGGIDRLEISSSSLLANVATAGDIVVFDNGGTTLANLDTTSGNIDISSNGSLEIDTVTTSGTGTVDISTTAGSLTDADANSDVNGTTVTLAATTGIGSVANAINTTADVLDLSAAGSLVNIGELDGVDLAAVTAADFTLSAGGAVTDSGTLAVTGTTDIDAGAGNDITLDTGSNDFGTVVITAGRNVSLVDTNALDLGASTVSGTLDVLAGGAISDSGNLLVTSQASFDASGADIILDSAGNDFSSVATSNANNVEFADINAIQLGSGASTVDTGGTFVVTASGVTQGAAVTAAGNTTINSSGFDVTLTNASNSFGGDVAVDGANVSITDNGDLAFGASTITGNLVAVANGTITDSGVVSVSGDADFDAGGVNATANAITLDGAGAGSLFNNVAISQAGNVTLVDQDAIILGNSGGGLAASGTLSVTTTSGSITDANAISATDASFSAGGPSSITLDNANDFDSFAVSAGNDVIFNDIDDVDLAGIAVSSSVTVDAGGDITTSGAITSGNGGTIDIANSAGDITISNAITADAAGAVLIDSAGALVVDAVLASTSGNINLASVGNASFGAGGDLSTGLGGTIDVASSTGSIIMDAGSSFDATVGGGAGSLALLANTNVDLGSLVGGGAVAVTASNGNITDVANDTAADITAASVTLAAATGIGATGANGSIDVSATTVDATNTTSGGIFINSVSGADVTFGTVDAQTAGDIELLADGTMHIGSVTGNSSVSIESTAGSIYDAQDDESDDVIGTDVLLAATGNIGGSDPSPAGGIDPEDQLEVNASNSLGLTADSVFIDDSSGNQLTLNFSGVNFEYSSDGNILVGFIDATGSVLLDTSNGYIRDDGFDAVDINGSSITLNASLDVGSGAALATQTDTMAVTAGGAIDIDNDFATAVTVSSLVAGGSIDFDQAGLGDVSLGSVDGTTITLGGAANVDVGSVTATGDLLVDGDSISQSGSWSAANINLAALTTIDLSNTVTASGDLVVNGDSISQSASWSAANIDLDAVTTIDLASSITASGNVDIDSGGLATLASTASVDAAGAVTFGAANTGGVNIAADITTQGGAISFNRAVSLTGNVLLDTTNGAAAGAGVSFDSTLDGGFLLDVAAGTAGDVSFNGVVGGLAPVAGITVVADQVSVNADMTTTAGGAVTFTNGGLLTLANGTNLSLGGAFTQDGAGLVDLGSNISTSGDVISFASAVSLTDAVSLDTASTSSIVFSGAITGGGNALTLSAGSATGTVQLAGGASNLGAFTIQNGAADLDADISASSVDLAHAANLAGNVDILSSGAISIGGNVTLSGAAGSSSLLSSGGDAAISLAGSVLGTDQSLAVQSEGDFSFTSMNLGNGTADLQVDSDSDTNFSTMSGTSVTAASVTLAGGTDGNDHIDVGTVTSSSGDITLASAMFLDSTLTLDSAGGITSSGQITGATGAGLVANNVAAFNINADINLDNAVLALNGPVDLGGSDRVLSNGSGDMTLSDLTGTGNLDIDSSGTFTLAGALDIGSLDNIGMTGAMQVSGTTSITTANTAIDLTSFSGIDADVAGSLALDAGTADIRLPVVGATTGLDSLTASGGQLNLVDVSTTGSQAYVGTMNLGGDLVAGTSLDLTGSVNLTAASTISAGTVSISGDIDGAQSLGINGITTVGGAIGQGTALSSLTTGGATTIAGAVSTTGTQTYNADVSLGGDVDGSALTFNGAVSFPNGAVVISDTIDFNGGASSVTGGGELSLVPATLDADIDIGGTSGVLNLNAAALDGYDAGLVIGGTISDDGLGNYTVDIVADGLVVNGGIDTGSGSLTLLSQSGISLVNGVLTGNQLILVAGSDTGTILNNGGSNTQLVSNNIVLVAGLDVGLQGQEIRATAQTSGELQIASGADSSAISDPTSSLVQLIGDDGPIGSAIANALGLVINNDLTVTNSALSSANREQSGGLADEGFIDPSLFEDIALYEVLGTGIQLPADQSEEGFFESPDSDCDPELEDCGAGAGPAGVVMPE